MNCPYCDNRLEWEDAEPDIGINSSGYYCENCQIIFDEEE
jgi:hypothetical protein